MIIRTEFNLKSLKNPVEFLTLAKRFDFRVNYLGEKGRSTHCINCRPCDYHAMLDMIEETNKAKRGEK